MKSEKSWQKNYTLNPLIEKYTVGDDCKNDQKLVKWEVISSIAHAKMLHAVGLLNGEELEKLVSGMKEILELNEKKKFVLDEKLEDVHTNVENFLTEKYGDVGKKLHTLRSRNDQILVDLRLYSKKQLLIAEEKLLELCVELLKFAKKNKSIAMPGYTHMQKSMPSAVCLWASSFIESLLDDYKVLENAFELNDQNPLGTAAGYGAPMEIDRAYTTNLLDFARIQQNPLYAQNSRGKIEAVTVNALLQVMFTLNKLATDLLLFSMEEFGFFKLKDELCTGSSIMPQKKNTDVFELMKAKSNVVLGELTKIYNISSNLPSGYNRNFQELKVPLINSFEITIASLDAAKLAIAGIETNKEKLEKSCTKDMYATHAAMELVKKGKPFRDAYKEIANNIDKLNINNLQVKKHGINFNSNFLFLEREIESKQGEIIAKKKQFEAAINEL